MSALAGDHWLANEAATLTLGAQLATLPCPQVVYLYGDLGAGKTTLVRGTLRALGYEGAVRSPTYTLLERYELGGKVIVHFDLHRLADPEELHALGLRELLEEAAMLFFEWIKALQMAQHLSPKRPNATVTAIRIFKPPKRLIGPALRRFGVP